ncbi:hypothetical protein GGI25_000863 [Coemansia spiralis]|uniref:Protein kinase domain-containing protein n=2 Tax=Coemansia TaxID=4863 RepID=A0A9W8GDZ0_9FUNG|nr:hypothetical protein EDC05_001770 [Coemansia umbellata]KAJ2623600.1 hypothetical protein GGI26_002238 [Coemansia sp. RSA 1358]KAJ2680270.1 hypothetical protein GGI25_000863 [Coemansia spiralis]
MGRLSLAIGRHKEGGDGRSKSRHLRSSIRGFLGIQGSERASVDLGEISEPTEEHSTSRHSMAVSKLPAVAISPLLADSSGSNAFGPSKEGHSSSTTATAVNTADMSAAIVSQKIADTAIAKAATASDTHVSACASTSTSENATDSNLTSDTQNNMELINSNQDDVQKRGTSRQQQDEEHPPQVPADISASMHAHAEIAPPHTHYAAGTVSPSAFTANEKPIGGGRFSIYADVDAALHGQPDKDDEKQGWRRRGSLISSRLAMPLRKESFNNGNGNRLLVRKESTPLFASSNKHHYHHFFGRSDSSDSSGRSPFWRSGSGLRSSVNAQGEQSQNLPAVEAVTRQERTHRSSSVPFITPILSSKDSNASFANNESSSSSRVLVSSASPGKLAGSPYLRAVSSGLVTNSPSSSNGAAASRLNYKHHSKSFGGSRQAQDRFPKISLAGNLDGSSPPGPPSPLALSVPSDKAAAAATPMTFLVSPRPRASTGARHGIAAPTHTLNRSSTSSREFNLCKRTLSSATIPSLDLNAPSSPKALAGTVDVSEFGVATDNGAADSSETRSNLPLPPSPISAGTPARSIASTSVSAAFEPLPEGAEDENEAEDDSHDQQATSGALAKVEAPTLFSDNLPAFTQQSQDPCSRRDGSGSTDAVHETHHMEIQHDPHTGRKMINQYMIIRELGRGTHGKVKLAFDTITGDYYAIKIIDKESRDRRLRPNTHTHKLHHGKGTAASRRYSSHRRSHGYLRIDFDKMEKVKREIAILKKCRHPNVVRLREVIDDAHARRIYLVIEYMDCGEILWRDSNKLPVMTHDEARSVFRDLVLGVEYLHYVGILHRDLKPQNLLRNKAGTVKISDFGVSFLSRRMSKRHLKSDGHEGSGAQMDTSFSSTTETASPIQDNPLLAQSPSRTQAIPPSPLRPAGMQAAVQTSPLHRYASQPLMSSSSPKLISGPVLQRKASVLSWNSKSLATNNLSSNRDNSKNNSAGDQNASVQSSISQQQGQQSLVPVDQMQQLQIQEPSDAIDSRQQQGSLSQSIQWPAMMGMTNEFGHRKGSLPLPVRSPKQKRHTRVFSVTGSPQVYKLPAECLSADSNVYDPFDSSDSAEFFSSSSSESSGSDSDYGNHYSSGGNIENDEHYVDNGSEEGIVFGATARPTTAATSDGLQPTGSDLPSDDRTAESVCSVKHERKGTLGEIDFVYDEKDEERELAKTAGTPAFFAPELCCTAEELARVLKEESAKRKTNAMNAIRLHRNTDPLSASHPLLSATAGQYITDGERDGKCEKVAGSNRPTSLYVENTFAGTVQGLNGAATLGVDGPRGSSVSKSAKRHSTIALLLTRPFSAKSRSSANSSSKRSSANDGQLGDAQAALVNPDESDLNPDLRAYDSSVADAADAQTELELGSEQALPSNVITPAIDIWAMGVTLYCLIYGRVPFQATTEFELFNIIPHKQLEFPEYLEIDDGDDDDSPDGLFLFHHPNEQKGGSTEANQQTQRPAKQRAKLPPLDPDLRDLLCRLLDKDFRTRITIEEIKQHPWVVRGLDHPSSWAKETDPTRRPSLKITTQEVEQAMIPKMRRSGGFRASVRRRISMLSPLSGSRNQRARARQQQQQSKGQSNEPAKTKSSLDWLKIW